MTSKDFRSVVGKRIGMAVTDAQVRHAIHVGDLQNVAKHGGWYFFGENHIDSMVKHLKNRSRKLAGASK